MSNYKPRKAEVPENRPKKLKFRDYDASMLETKILCGTFRMTQLQGVKMTEIEELHKRIRRDYPMMLKHIKSMCDDFTLADPTKLNSQTKMLNVVLFAYVIKGFSSELNLLSNDTVNNFVSKQKDYCSDIAETNEYIDILEEEENKNNNTNDDNVITIN